VSGRRIIRTWGFLAVLVGALAVASPTPAGAAPKRSGHHPKLDRALEKAARLRTGHSRVIIEFESAAPAGLVTRGFDAILGRRLRTFDGTVALVPNARLEDLARHPLVKRVHLDRPTGGEMNRTAVVVGARAVQHALGFDGSGVGIAIIDSGITAWHDDLAGAGIGGQRVVQFVDFVNHQPLPYDDNGHGTHVAGIIAGNGYDSYGARAGIAPGAHLIGLKVLDEHGAGYISDVIAALDWVVAHKDTYNIRVVNLSVGAAVTESYWTDPLTLAAKTAVEAGIVVVAAAGNLGRNAQGQPQYGGITAPGNAPWVLTVGASSHMGTITRVDDTVAGFSSRGPTYLDFSAKPDLVAPGVGTVSLSDPNSLFYTTKANYLLWGRRSTSYKPYLSLSGTSMAAPVVTGTVALMLQANPALTPNAVKAILQYTAQVYPGYDFLTQGAGFLNTRGAVQLAHFFRTARPGARFPKSKAWSRHVFWGNHRVRGGMILPTANAWATNVVWGADRDADGDNIVWGALCPSGADCDNIVWGSTALEGENIVWGVDCSAESPDCDNIVWGTSVDTDGDGLLDNIVWGTTCDAQTPDCDNIVWGTSLVDTDGDGTGDNIVWGTAEDAENIVWGNDCAGADCENIVWGASVESLDGDNIVWGTAEDAENIVWGTNGEIDNIVWGTSSEADNITWGNATFDNVVFDEMSETEAQLAADPNVFEQLFETDGVTTAIVTDTSSTPSSGATTGSTSTSSTTTTETLLDGTVVTTTTVVATTVEADGTTTTTTTTTVTTVAPDGTTTTTTSSTTGTSGGGA